ncbi:MAG: valine--tRNA ligase [Sporichthyaceae bacterium]
MNDAPATELPTRYAPAEVEEPLYEKWVKARYFEVDANSDKPGYAIVIPPPNVTGSLHIGHALDHTIQDILIRWRRMQGYEALWLPGMDHAGIATQNVVEKQLAAQGLTRHDLGREAFVEKVWEWKHESGGKILGQMRRLGDSVAWERERFTMDEGLSRAVLTMFKTLYDGGLIYRANRITNWCPRCLTALSDIEVEHSEDEGELVSIRYGDGDAEIVVATTRAETMLGDTAVAVHPTDERYAHLIGTDVELPLTGRRIPIVADEHVDPAFGTGAVKVTPAHDPNDFEIGRRHSLPELTIMDDHAVVNLPGQFEGMDRYDARRAVVEALRAEGRIVAEKRPYLHSVGHCSRCGTVVEPRLSLQWYVNVEPLSKAAGDAVRDGRVAIAPKEMEPRWFAWVDNMHDWCISRQLWWGHRIPVWYGPDGEVRCVGPDDELPGEGWTQDSDVLDTWFSSGLWPFSTLGWPDRTPELAKFYPTSVLVTGYDILFFWVARMMMFGLYAMKDDGPSGSAGLDNDVPFRTVALHGMVRDQFGKKMSKTRGNVVDPLVWIDQYGADATRLTLARGANPGSDVPVSEDWVLGSRNFCNKLWNATRFALLNGATAGEVPAAEKLSPADRWILSRLYATVEKIDAYYGEFEFAKAADALYHLVWDEFCDWYLELAKAPLARGGEEAATTNAVLGHVLDVLLRLLHPIVPFVTETLWTTLTGGESIVIAQWPKARPDLIDPAAEAQIVAVQDLVTEIRRFRADQGLPPAKKVAARIVADGSVAGLAEHADQIKALTKLTPAEDGFVAGATLQVPGANVELDLSGAIDVEAERARLTKDLAAAQAEIVAADAKLANAEFIGKAPEKVVDKIRARRETGQADVARITAQLDALA